MPLHSRLHEARLAQQRRNIEPLLPDSRAAVRTKTWQMLLHPPASAVCFRGLGLNGAGDCAIAPFRRSAN